MSSTMTIARLANPALRLPATLRVPVQANTCRRRASTFTGPSEETLTETQLDVRRKLCDQGWIGIAMPAQYGGAGLGISEAVVMVQTIAESAGFAAAQSVHANVYPVLPIIAFGTEEQKQQWLPRILDGRIRTCFGVTEPTAGSETLKLSTRAAKQGDHYTVHGQKMWTSSASIASHCVLLTRTATPDAAVKQSRSHGLTVLLAQLRDRPDDDRCNGSTKTQLYKGVEMRKIPKMGGNHVDACEVWYDGLTVPVVNRLGEEHQGWKVILHSMNGERCLIAGEALGTGYNALRRAVAYVSQRVLYGKTVGELQAVQHSLAKCWAQLEAARHLTYAAARAFDAGSPDTGALANSAKYCATEAGVKACYESMMAMGGMGYSKDYHVERLFREILVPQLAPVSRENVLNYIGTKVLGLGKSY